MAATLRRRMRQRGSVRPLVRKLDRGGDRYLVGDRVCGIQNQLIPVHVSLHWGRGVAGSEIVSRYIGSHQAEVGHQEIGSGRNRDMEAKHVHRVANPGDTLAVRGKAQVHQVGDGSGGRMVSGYPFGVYEINGVRQTAKPPGKTHGRTESFAKWSLRRLPEQWWMLFLCRTAVADNTIQARMAQERRHGAKEKGQFALLLSQEDAVRSRLPWKGLALRWKRTPSRCCKN